MTQLKDLYVGKNLEDLEKHYNILDSSIKNKKIQVICKTAVNIRERAEDYHRICDEEYAFIFYMKYIGILSYLKSNREFNKEKEYIKIYFGTGSAMNETLNRIEALKNSLKRRYKQLQLAESMLNNADNQMEETINDNDETGPARNLNKIVIDCDSLYKMLTDPQISILLIDCRPSVDFEASKLTFPHYLNVPEECIQQGLTAPKIARTLAPEAKIQFTARYHKDHIILLDTDTTESQYNKVNSPMKIFREILTHWDLDAEYRYPILVLDGGYTNFILKYPMTSTDPKYVSKSKIIDNNSIDIIDDIEYPSINDINMKDEIKSFQDTNTKIPFVNRGSKSAAIEIYERKKDLTGILIKQEELAEKTLQNSRNMLNAEAQLKELDALKENADENLRAEFNVKELEYVYRILQLENKQKDYVSEIEQLRKEVDEAQKDKLKNDSLNNNVDKHLTSIAEPEAENNEERQQRIKEKENEYEELKRKREAYVQEREAKMLTVDREQKRRLIEMTENKENIVTKQQPQFDRSIKPNLQTPNTIIQPVIHRDFSPEYGSMGPGLTGLKNLGNTCYMNSIMQCLSNTSALVEYFVSGDYTKYINRSNKTQGRIVEEVSAVIRELWNGQYKCIASKDLRYIVGQYQNIFRGVDQQDSHEFLTILMDWMHSDLQTVDVGKVTHLIDEVMSRYRQQLYYDIQLVKFIQTLRRCNMKKFAKENLSPSEKAWLDFVKCKESYILKLFYGQIKSTVKCIVCKKESATYDGFSNLSLELPSTCNRCDIQDCLGMYFNGEHVFGWNCPNCKEKRTAIKKLDISKLPPILVIHLKRFHADLDSTTNVYRKKQTYVKFPLTNLDMSNYLARSESRTAKRSYNLYGVSNHYGTMERGHYTAFCRNRVFQRWFKFDDHIVSNLDTSDVISSGAYILFYTTFSDDVSYDK